VNERERKLEVNIPLEHKENIPFKRDIIEIITSKEKLGNFYIFKAILQAFKLASIARSNVRFEYYFL